MGRSSCFNWVGQKVSPRGDSGTRRSRSDKEKSMLGRGNGGFRDPQKESGMFEGQIKSQRSWSRTRGKGGIEVSQPKADPTGSGGQGKKFGF